MKIPQILRQFGSRADPHPTLSLDEWSQMFNWFGFAGLQYPYTVNQTLAGTANQEEIAASFTGFVGGGYERNAVVFACIMNRMLLFSEARFKFRGQSRGRPGDLFGTQDLALLETPWPNGTTGDLLARMILDADLAGNFFATKVFVNGTTRLKRLRPDWVTIVLGSTDVRYPIENWTPYNLDAEIVGYFYHPGGRAAGREPDVLLPEQICHFAPIPDPLAEYRGMSWLTPVVREILGDSAATTHKLKFFEHGATPNMIISLDPSIQIDAFKKWVSMFKDRHEGVANAYKTIYLGGGAQAQVVGANLRQIDFKITQGAGETRIAAAAGVPPVIVGLSEGLAAATYSNYAQARRRFADMTMRPLWRNAAASLSPLVTVPALSELWYDDRDIPALQEDARDQADIRQVQAATMKTLIDAGFIPDDVVSAVTSGDMSKLQHTGLVSVQLMPPGEPAPSPNGASPPTVPVP